MQAFWLSVLGVFQIDSIRNKISLGDVVENQCHVNRRQITDG
jgi:hypothetical protein